MLNTEDETQKCFLVECLEQISEIDIVHTDGGEHQFKLGDDNLENKILPRFLLADHRFQT